MKCELERFSFSWNYYSPSPVRSFSEWEKVAEGRMRASGGPAQAGDPYTDDLDGMHRITVKTLRCDDFPPNFAAGGAGLDSWTGNP